MAEQQPLGGRSLSGAVLQAPDLIGESFQRQQHKDKMAVARLKAAPKLKAYDKDLSLESYGDLFTGAYKNIGDQMRKFIFENAYKLHPDSAAYDPEVAMKFKNTVAAANNYAVKFKQANKLYHDDMDGLEQKNIDALGGLAYTEDAVNFGNNLKANFDLGTVGYTDEDGTFVKADESPILSNPRSYWYKQRSWGDEMIDAVEKTLVSTKKDGRAITQADMTKIRGQVVDNLMIGDNSSDLMASITSDYIQDVLGVSNPSNEVIRAVVENGVYDNGRTVITEDDILDYAKDFTERQIENRIGFTDREDDGSGLNISIGGARQKLGIVPAEGLPLPTTDGDEYLGDAVAMKGITIDTPGGRKTMSNLYVTPNGEVYYGGTEARNRTKEEIEQLTNEYGGVENIPQGLYFGAFSKNYEKATDKDMDSLRAAIKAKTGYSMDSNSELPTFIRGEEQAEQEGDSDKGFDWEE